MIVGVAESSKFNMKQVRAVGFDYVELSMQNVQLEGLTREILKDKISYLWMIEESYLVISTMGDVSEVDFISLVQEAKDIILKYNVPIYVENGMSGSDEEGYLHNDFSETKDIVRMVKHANEITGSELFGVAVSIGNANLLAKNTRFIIEDAKDYLRLLHVSDNDGFHNDKQMPYTFTVGRGDQTTDWEQIIGALIRIGYDGRMVFDTEGLFNRMPAFIADKMLNLLANIALYWLSIMTFEDVLDENKKIILFGAGRMASNFMYVWGEKYMPDFIVDNDEKRWGAMHRGVQVKNPEAIFDVPEEDRIVVICSMNHEGIGLQLRKMGVPYITYNDNFYDFVPQ